VSSPTARTLEKLRKEGWTCAVVEHWNPHAHIRQDLGGGIDVLAWKPKSTGQWSSQILGIQACADTGGSGMAAHRAKLLREPKMATWVAAGGRLEIWAWGKKGARGERKLWECRVEVLRLGDFIPAGSEGNEATG
jgi:hypothetical protein